MFKKAIAGAVCLFGSYSAHGAQENLAKFTDMAGSLGTVMGAADYCGDSAQSLSGGFERGLQQFKLSKKDTQSVMGAMAARRSEARKQAAEKFSNQACTADARQKIASAMQAIEDAWYRTVQNETGVDVRKASSTGGVAAKGRHRDGNSSAAQAQPQQTEKSRPASESTGKAAAVRVGKYNCYTFDSGQLNYTYTDVQIKDGSRYAVGKKQGTYTMSPDGSVRFTGTMSNAVGRYELKRGKPQLDLIFNGDPRASMTCPWAG